MKKSILLLIPVIMLSTQEMKAQLSENLVVEKDFSTSFQQENIKSAIAVSNAILECKWGELDQLLGDGFTYTGDGYVFTKDEYIGFMQDMRAAFSDFKMILTHVVADEEMVCIRFISRVVNTGKFMGAPANQKNLEVNGIFIRKVDNGKVMQEWQTTDLLGTMNQIGFGAMFPYAIFVTGFNAKAPGPKRKPNDFLQIDGDFKNYDKLSPKEKNKYVKQYLKKL